MSLWAGSICFKKPPAVIVSVFSFTLRSEFNLYWQSTAELISSKMMNLWIINDGWTKFNFFCFATGFGWHHFWTWVMRLQTMTLIYYHWLLRPTMSNHEWSSSMIEFVCLNFMIHIFHIQNSYYVHDSSLSFIIDHSFFFIFIILIFGSDMILIIWWLTDWFIMFFVI